LPQQIPFILVCTFKFNYNKKNNNFCCINLENERNKGVFIPYDLIDTKFIYISYMNEEDIEIITNKIYNHFCRSYSLNFVDK